MKFVQVCGVCKKNPPIYRAVVEGRQTMICHECKCELSEKQRIYHNAYVRQKYQNDPVYQARRREISRKSAERAVERKPSVFRTGGTTPIKQYKSGDVTGIEIDEATV